jgi:hypothetical protein
MYFPDYLGNTQPKYSTPTKSEVTKMKHGASHETQASAPTSGRESTVSSRHKKKKNDGLSEGGSSHVIGTDTTKSENQMGNSNLEHSSLKKKKKQKMVQVWWELI